jgi:hypothetical protein
MGSFEVLFLQMKPYLISHLKLVWYPMLIMALLVLGIGFLNNVMNLLLNVLDLLKKFGYSINIGLSIGGLFMCIWNVHSYVNGVQWMEPQAHLKSTMDNRYVEGSILAMLNISKALIPCVCMFVILHP